MESLSFIDHFEIWLRAYLILSLFSFLYRDNAFYKLSEHIFAGLSAGYYVGLIWHSVIIQQLVDPMFRNGEWTLIFPGFLGILMFARLSKNYSWISRTSLAFVMGSTAGIYLISNLHGFVLKQTAASMVSITGKGEGGFAATVLAVIVVVGVITTLIYFYFSKEHKGFLGGAAKIGIWFIMIAFGAHFGYTVMGRISLLIGRVQFLVFEWWGASIGSIF